MRFVYVWRLFVVVVAVAILLTVALPMVDVMNDPKFSGEFTIVLIAYVMWPFVWAWAMSRIVKHWLKGKKNDTSHP